MSAVGRCRIVAALYVVVTLVAGSCGDGDDDAFPATNVTVASTGETSTDGAAGPPADLSGELLTASDLQGEWDAPGPQPIPELDVDGTLGPACPEGETVTLDDPDNSIRAAGNASITLSALDETDLEVTELLIHDGRGSVFEAFASVFGSCVGGSFEQGSDPVETVQYEQLNMALPGDDAVAFVRRWGTGGELDGGEVAYALVRAGEVVVVLNVIREGITEPYEQELLMAAATAAVARVTDGTWSPGVFDAPVAPELEAPSEVTVDGAGDIVVRPSDGCRFFEDEDHSYTVAVPEDFTSEFEPNTQWFIEQAFATFSDISLDVRADVVYLTVYETTDYGDSIGYDKASLDITEQVAAELRQRIGNRAICN